MAIIVENRFYHGEIVYLKTDREQLPRLVSCIKVYSQGEVMYELISGTLSSVHYEFEISKEKNLVDAL